MKAFRTFALVLGTVIPAFAFAQPPSEVRIDISGGAQRIPIRCETIQSAGDKESQSWALQAQEVLAHDLDWSAVFNVSRAWVPGETGADAQAIVGGTLTLRRDEIVLAGQVKDVPAGRPIMAHEYRGKLAEWRDVVHRFSDDIVLQFTGEPGVADTKLAYVVGPPGSKEIVVADYDGAGAGNVTRNASINLSPSWSPDARSIAFTSFMNGYPDLFRLFPFERQRPVQTLASFVGINSSPGWSPDGRYLALTLSKDGNPEIYVLTLATGVLQRLTRHAGIDTEPTWSPSGQQIAFVSDRAGQPRIYVMDKDGSNVRQLTSGGFHTQPRWSPKGDPIVYTQRSGTHDLWAISPGGSSPRQLTSGGGDNQSATWAPDGRHLAFQSNRTGRWQLFFMTVEGQTTTQVTQGSNEATSPSWSPRLP